MRLIAPKALLYTEMQTPCAIQNNPQRALLYSGIEHPLALQVGGSEVSALVTCAKIAEDKGFSEINLNLGCPSDRVQAGRFGACMMKEPVLAAKCIEAMKNAVSIPVTAKTRIGVDHEDSYDFFASFAHTLARAGCDKLIIHARKAWLTGLSPKQNRTIPPIQYQFAYDLKKELPDIPVVINGNINEINSIHAHMAQVDGIMLGRLACNNPYALAAIHQIFYPKVVLPSREQIMNAYLDYAQLQLKQGVPMSILCKPILNFAHGLDFSKKWKERVLSAQKEHCFSSLFNIKTVN
jgi:tRNA-dihydrouridine synthase A